MNKAAALDLAVPAKWLEQSGARGALAVPPVHPLAGDRNDPSLRGLQQRRGAGELPIGSRNHRRNHVCMAALHRKAA